MDVAGRTAIVTGAGSGIGRAIALELARHGARVVGCGRRLDRVQETQQRVEAESGVMQSIACDVTDRAQVQAMTQSAVDAFGSLDILFNNAGSFITLGGLWEVDPEDWWTDATINLKGPMLTTHAALPHMMKRNEGCIINMNGGGATAPLPGGSAYGSSKAGLIRFTETLAKELQREGSEVLIFSLGPGYVHTEMTEYQAVHAMGKKWLPGSREALDGGKTSPPELCAKATIQLLKIACPELSGRIFSAGDDFDAIAQQASQIEAKNQRVMR